MKAFRLIDTRIEKPHQCKAIPLLADGSLDGESQKNPGNAPVLQQIRPPVLKNDGFAKFFRPFCDGAVLCISKTPGRRPGAFQTLCYTRRRISQNRHFLAREGESAAKLSRKRTGINGLSEIGANACRFRVILCTIVLLVRV